MRKDTRSRCPINLSLELFGDRWTLIVLRDVIFGDSRHFRALLAGPERISSNILSDRLGLLVERGLLTRSGDASHRQKVTYSLTEQAIELVPVFAQIAAWGNAHLPVSAAYAARTAVLVAGGPAFWDAFMDELREAHLGPAARRLTPPAGPSPRTRMDAAHAAALAVAG